ncbi:hypothetical protein, partial [Burkholderia multivorans]|uniref:hypothetical protein n=1 Tax=Burkholderia multivorans TaxID=87883 RepID=UPI001C65BB8E
MNLAVRFCPCRKENTDSFNSFRNGRHYLHDRPRAHTAAKTTTGGRAARRLPRTRRRAAIGR